MLGFRLINGESVCINPDFTLLGWKKTVGLEVGRSDFNALTWVSNSVLGFRLTNSESVWIISDSQLIDLKLAVRVTVGISDGLALDY